MLRFFQCCFVGHASDEEIQAITPKTPKKYDKNVKRLSVSSEVIPVTPSPHKVNTNTANFSSGSVETVDGNKKLETGIPDNLYDLLGDDSEEAVSPRSHYEYDEDLGPYTGFNNTSP